MSNKTKNIITNILGLILFAFNTFEFYFDEFSLLQYLGGLVVALALFLFKATETKEWLRKALSKFSS
tara:strand:+ start:1224 stop:1424 length:201 start_codon:yes stop_codon:yes gene_type:complete